MEPNNAPSIFSLVFISARRRILVIFSVFLLMFLCFFAIQSFNEASNRISEGVRKFFVDGKRSMQTFDRMGIDISLASSFESDWFEFVSVSDESGMTITSKGAAPQSIIDLKTYVPQREVHKSRMFAVKGLNLYHVFSYTEYVEGYGFVTAFGAANYQKRIMAMLWDIARIVMVMFAFGFLVVVSIRISLRNNLSSLGDLAKHLEESRGDLDAVFEGKEFFNVQGYEIRVFVERMLTLTQKLREALLQEREMEKDRAVASGKFQDTCRLGIS